MCLHKILCDNIVCPSAFDNWSKVAMALCVGVMSFKRWIMAIQLSSLGSLQVKILRSPRLKKVQQVLNDNEMFFLTRGIENLFLSFTMSWGASMICVMEKIRTLKKLNWLLHYYNVPTCTFLKWCDFQQIGW